MAFGLIQHEFFFLIRTLSIQFLVEQMRHIGARGSLMFIQEVGFGYLFIIAAFFSILRSFFAYLLLLIWIFSSDSYTEGIVCSLILLLGFGPCLGAYELW